MASARQIARWIVDDIVADIQDVSTLDRAWKKLTEKKQREIVLQWMTWAEAYAKKYEPGDDEL